MVNPLFFVGDFVNKLLDFITLFILASLDVLDRLMIFFERGDNLIAFFLGFSITLNIMFVVVLFVVLRFKKKANKLLDFNTDEVEDINSLYDFFK